MKKGLIRVACVLLTMVLWFSSCGKKSINGRLDGRWQLISVEYCDNGEIEFPDYIYYDINLRVLKLWKTQELDGSFGPRMLGRFNHDGDSLHIHMLGLSLNAVKPFGMNDTIQHFEVETLTKKKMILKSIYARLKFRKF